MGERVDVQEARSTAELTKDPEEWLDAEEEIQEEAEQQDEQQEEQQDAQQEWSEKEEGEERREETQRKAAQVQKDEDVRATTKRCEKRFNMLNPSCLRGGKPKKDALRESTGESETVGDKEAQEVVVEVRQTVVQGEKHIVETDRESGKDSKVCPRQSAPEEEEVDKPLDREEETKKAGRGRPKLILQPDTNQPSVSKFMKPSGPSPKEVRVRIVLFTEGEWRIFIYQASDGPWRLLKLKQTPRSITARTVLGEAQCIQCVANDIKIGDVDISYTLVKEGHVELWTVKFKKDCGAAGPRAMGLDSSAEPSGPKQSGCDSEVGPVGDTGSG